MYISIHPVGGPPELIPRQLHFCIQVTLEPPSHFVAGRVAKAGLLLRSHPDAEPAPAGSEASGRHGAALLYDWRTSRLELVS